MSTVSINLSAEPDRLLRLPDVKRLCGFNATSTYYRLMQAGEFPAPVKLGVRAVAWRSAAIGAWLAARDCARAIATVPSAEAA
jgi:prophage regulatory protein